MVGIGIGEEDFEIRRQGQPASFRAMATQQELDDLDDLDGPLPFPRILASSND
jgi:hypothetical protein